MPSTAKDPGAAEIACDVLVVGGGLGGVAAALRAARLGGRVCLLEETGWLGGQISPQGGSHLGQPAHPQAFGGTAPHLALPNASPPHYPSPPRLSGQVPRATLANP